MLKRRNPAMRALVADAIRECAARHLPGLHGTVKPLIALLRSRHGRYSVATAAAAALGALNARASASDLLRLDEAGRLEGGLIADDALARWRYGPADELWQKRAEDRKALIGLRLSAIAALGRAGVSGAASTLGRLATNKQDKIPIRFAAAKALGRLGAPSAVSIAAPLAGAQASMIDQLLAAAMLYHAKSGAGRAMLLNLAKSPRSVVVQWAVQGLLPGQAAALAPLDVSLAQNRDQDVRVLAVQVMRLQKAAANSPLIVTLLGDRRRAVRNAAYSAAVALGQMPNLRQSMLLAARQGLANGNADRQAGSARILGALNDTFSIGLLVPMIGPGRHAAMRVRLAVVTALVQLKAGRVDSAVYRFVQSTLTAESRPAPPKPTPAWFAKGSSRLRQVAEAFQLFGRTGYTVATPLMLSFVPKGSFPSNDARCAAIWALCRFHAGKADAALVGRLEGRINDNNFLDPESMQVKVMSAVGLGIMQANAAMPMLESIAADKLKPLPLRVAARWACMHTLHKAVPPIVENFAVAAGPIQPLGGGRASSPDSSSSR